MHDFREGKSLNCEETIPCLDDFLAGQIDVEIRRRVAEHLEACDACRKDAARRRAAREALRSSWTAMKAPDSLAARIRSDLEKRNRPTFGWKQTAAVAAALVVTVALGWLFVAQAPDPDGAHQLQVVDHFEEIAADHLRCRGEVTQRSHLPLDPSFDEIESTLRESPLNLQLLGIMDCQVREAEFLHYVFRGNEGLFSMMLEYRQSNERLPNAGHLVELEGEPIQTIHQGPLVVASLVSREYFVYLTGDELSEEELLGVTARILEPLRSALSREVALRIPTPIL